MSWSTQEFPGYLGKKREEIHQYWNREYGEGNWRIRYQWNGQIIERDIALQLYEDGYYEFFKIHTDQLEWLLNTASDVYDTAPSNVDAGLRYDIQETSNNHIHDVAIRRAVYRLGHVFNGDHLVHVRGEQTEGFHLNPGNVPFHLPNLILNVTTKDYGNKGQWWKSGSIEDFYQKNKVLEVRKIGFQGSE